MGLPLVSLLKSIGGAVAAPIGRRIGNALLPGTPFSGGVSSTAILPVVEERPGDIPYFPDALEDLLGIGGGAEQPTNGQASGDCFELPTTVPAQIEGRVVCPTGYVSVKCGDQKVCMLKPVARALGKWKARRKPPISAADWRRFKTAQRVENKLLGIAKDAGIKSPQKRKRNASCR